MRRGEGSVRRGEWECKEGRRRVRQVESCFYVDFRHTLHPNTLNS